MIRQATYKSITYSNKTSFFHFVNKRAIYLYGKISLAHDRCTYLMKSQNKIIYAFVNVFFYIL